MIVQALSLRRGEPIAVRFTLSKSDGSPYAPASAQEITFTAKLGATTLVTLTRTGTDIANDGADACLVSIDPSAISENVSVYTLIVRDASGIDDVLATGPLVLEPVGFTATATCVLYGQAGAGELVRIRLLPGQALADGSPALTYPQNVYADQQGTWAAMVPQGLKFRLEAGETDMQGTVPNASTATLTACGMEDSPL